MERLTFEGNFCDIAQCRELPCPYNGSCSQRKAWERLKAYENTGLTPERCAEFARADAEGRYIVMRDAEQEGVARLRELAEADKDGRLVVLPCKVGNTVIDQTFAETPRLMKNTRLEIAYESRCGIIFHMGYDIFADLVEHGRIKPVSEEAAGVLQSMLTVSRKPKQTQTKPTQAKAGA